MACCDFDIAELPRRDAAAKSHCEGHGKNYSGERSVSRVWRVATILAATISRLNLASASACVVS
jgi:hypothetical protein